MNGMDIFTVQKVNAVLRELIDIRDIPGQLRWRDRIAVRDATEGEILGRFTGRIYVSDIIMTGGRAIVKSGGKFTTDTVAIPKIKHGTPIDEEMITLLNRIESNGGVNFDELTLKGYVANRIDDLLLGIRQRENILCLAMKLDTFSYSRGGVVIEQANWGAPAQFKTRVIVDWTDPINSTPIADITAQIQHDREVWGEVRTRVTMATVTLRLILATNEFKAKAQLYSLIVFPAGAFPLTADLGPARTLLSTILEGLTLEFEDGRYWDQLEDGSEVVTPYLEPNLVILDNPADDNNPSAAYLGNAVVPETIVASMADTPIIGRFASPQTGPITYVEAPSLNPPGMAIWGVTKSWPVRGRKGLTTVMTVY